VGPSQMIRRVKFKRVRQMDIDLQSKLLGVYTCLALSGDSSPYPWIS